MTCHLVNSNHVNHRLASETKYTAKEKRNVFDVLNIRQGWNNQNVNEWMRDNWHRNDEGSLMKAK
jgi:hypothetical protein